MIRIHQWLGISIDILLNMYVEKMGDEWNTKAPEHTLHAFLKPQISLAPYIWYK